MAKPAVAVLLVALTGGLLYLAIGGEDADDGATVTRSVDGITYEGDSTEDENLAEDLAAYMARACARIGGYTYADFRRGFSGDSPETRATRRLFISRYGDLRTAFEAQQDRCASYENVVVEDAVVTVETSLGSGRLDRISAADTCQVIQGADVADFTPGHTVLDTDGDLLARCEARTG